MAATPEGFSSAKGPAPQANGEAVLPRNQRKKQAKAAAQAAAQAGGAPSNQGKAAGKQKQTPQKQTTTSQATDVKVGAYVERKGIYPYINGAFSIGARLTP